MISSFHSQNLSIVLHRIVKQNACSLEWEDVQVDTFRIITNLCKGRTVLPNSMSQGADRCWLISFDDGHISDFEFAFPLLIENDCQAVFFIVTDFVGSNGYMDWPHIKELAQNGMCIGSHSKSHKDLSKLNDSDLMDELEISKDVLEQKLGIEIQNLSFPYGKFSSKVVAKARNVGYRYLHGSDHGFLADDALVFSRNSINGYMSLAQVKGILCPNYSKRAQWIMEDFLKVLAKRMFGDRLYRIIRNNIFATSK